VDLTFWNLNTHGILIRRISERTTRIVGVVWGKSLLLFECTRALSREGEVMVKHGASSFPLV
jgi:hypothetical protein